ncbi:bifunctional tRNA (5-methylaminomethyl-2-thiouridine)(34)-methyltransferase MnmD/FAD-dependent 5-carboxymethylaminomethyl-2-thiouridine(34) oxidoreductase MnmC [Larsenimonas rhizosphaerae]|uniref:bifunctional tRNA (5-methylaminomethyl-2-thiouridine)(34)-methyltransferase MnmD/FAD-dependent 5-carboxymethylaminomethyl-2-thiouridine(34) oxidoreductase MnmC n=1 Tax=Larsenimonas rhizosphaerae TaxID=2944682 RepID=UPI002033E14A|nr:bifunctional tRNA (5-methylaminomethyl-2-thiouridine)(34)-methyltransferase MnmD/FAD-dependent 5-carboxymethylaminomethyl-2-thiouridine(34) oxidoreductase MnmC [Larsenimonas rhizosphaerae]
MTDTLPTAGLTPARLSWRDDAPEADDYGDVYFSREDGLEETRHVFIHHNHLPERLADWDESRPFVIGETGFGSGLNMLCACACFEQYAQPTARLHLVSVEKHPFSPDDLKRAQSAWPMLAPWAEAIQRQWPAPVAGIHRLVLSERITLDLHLGEAVEMITALDGTVDAWFLDGFAPSRNPDMWQPALFEAMARVSRPRATFATFTCAGFVKRGLKAAGFAIKKVAGYGRKREMLVGELVESTPTAPRAATPWFIPPTPPQGDTIAVIGAGLAGISCAEALARRGRRVLLIDPAPGQGGSGNDQGALYIKPAASPNDQSHFYLAGLQYSLRWLARLDPSMAHWAPCGVLSLALDEKGLTRQRTMLARFGLPDTLLREVSCEEAGRLAGTPVASGGIYFPTAGWASPRGLCHLARQWPGITLTTAALSSLDYQDDNWHLMLDTGATLRADQVILACAEATRHWPEAAHLPLQPIKGQVSQAPALEATPGPECVVCGRGYAPPPHLGLQSFGASFHPGHTDTEVSREDHEYNLTVLAEALPDYTTHLLANAPNLKGRSALRCATPDKSPFIGPAPRAERWRTDYQGLGKDARRFHSDVPGACWPGLWISTGHGSRGLCSAPLAAEILASRICDEPAPLPRHLMDHLHPGRRIIRDLIRGH